MQPNIKLFPALLIVIVINIALFIGFSLAAKKVENPIRAKEVEYEKITFNDDEGLWLPLKNFPQDVPIVGVTVLYEWKEPKE